MSSSPSSIRSRRPTTVLAVGHQSDELALLLGAMRIRGWSVELTTAGEAGTRLTAVLPHAVLVDQGGRPAADAFAIGRRLRESARTPVVVMTTLQMPQISDVARSAGCVAVSKPCRASAVITTITSAVALTGGRAWLDVSRRSG